MAAVRVVTDSTASLAPGRASRSGMIVVPLQVVLDGTSAPEACDGGSGAGSPDPDVANITGAEVAAALRAGVTVTTSRPSAEAFAAAYREAADGGAGAVVSVHLSRAISGTCDAAELAAQDAPIPVTVLDSGTLAMALGYAALAGAGAAADGAAAREVAGLVERRAAASSAFFSVDSLDYLRRGGRIGAAQALLGSALAVKPLLTVSDGVIQPYERVRTRAKAVARLQELACAAGVSAAAPAGGSGVGIDLAVHHLDAGAAADELADQLQIALGSAGVRVEELVVSQVSAVLGVHVGPGTLGVVVSPRVP